MGDGGVALFPGRSSPKGSVVNVASSLTQR